MRAKRPIAAVLAIGVLVVPAVALAVAPPRPAAGKWKLAPHGGFTMSKDQKSMSNIHLNPGPASGCGTGKITIVGAHKLRTTSRGGFTNWLVGKSTPQTSSGVTPIKVTVHQAGKTMTGGFYMLFAVAGNKKDNSGEFSLGPSCLIVISASK